ncbi:tail fiber protein [Pantoea phage vB_PagM_AAM37]|uniref:Tail fiber protein n=1 Tax=Pantoea phage vB_PagM_AAM37 TaxID=2588093 RepID=A0A513ZYB1_9CAUD|nr:tail protein [Pantoea phage vB_PagM_AAM37]QDH45699.1 tail fiber protein [Pantoea phage vB_PagM_AAM37]
MADIELKYLQDLEAASKVSSGDLMHLSQSSLDKSVTIGVLTAYFMDLFTPVGTVMFRGDAANPNQLFPGTTWVKLPANQVIRTSAENASDVLTTGGADSVSLNNDHLPSHSHTFSNGSTSQSGNHSHRVWTGAAGGHAHSAYTDAQGNHAHRAWTDAQGAHSHPFLGAGGTGSGSGLLIGVKEFEIGAGSAIHNAGLHSHNVGMDAAGNHGHNITVNAVGAHDHAAAMDPAGNHTHTVTGTIGLTGSNSPFSVVNAHVKLVGWRRTK